MKRLVTMALTALFLVPGVLAQQQGMKISHSLVSGDEVASCTLVPGSGGQRGELVVFEKTGRVRQFHVSHDRGFEEFSGSLVLEKAERVLVTLSPGNKEGQAGSLFALTHKGLYRYDRNEKGQFVQPGRRVVKRARFRLRVGGPLVTPFLQDVNGDKVLDLVVPGRDACELWLGDRDTFRRTARIRVKVRVEQGVGSSVGDDRFFQSIQIPDLDVRDMNGDGRQDVVVMRGSQTRIHRQKPDGSIPFDPDVILDLEKFKDTSPKATVRPGRTLAGNERANLLIRDLDGDGIPDYVISHRRKVWVFHGDRDGPQFSRPTRTLKVADDITFIWLARVGEDAFADLMVIRVEVPTIGTLITGLFGSIDISMRVLVYESVDGRSFSKEPRWKNELTFILPSLGEIMRNPEALLRRFEEAISSIRESFLADVNGDGLKDLVLFDKNITRADIWLAGRGKALSQQENLDALVVDVFIESRDSRWDLDRLFSWIEDLGDSRAARWTKNRKPDRSVVFRSDDEHQPLYILHGDLTGDGREELVVVYRILGKRSSFRFDLLR